MMYMVMYEGKLLQSMQIQFLYTDCFAVPPYNYASRQGYFFLLDNVWCSPEMAREYVSHIT